MARGRGSGCTHSRRACTASILMYNDNANSTSLLSNKFGNNTLIRTGNSTKRRVTVREVSDETCMRGRGIGGRSQPPPPVSRHPTTSLSNVTSRRSSVPASHIMFSQHRLGSCSHNPSYHGESSNSCMRMVTISAGFFTHLAYIAISILYGVRQ